MHFHELQIGERFFATKSNFLLKEGIVFVHVKVDAHWAMEERLLFCDEFKGCETVVPFTEDRSFFRAR